MGNLFSKKKVSKVTEQDRAVLQLKKQRDDLIIYQKRLYLTIEKDREIARRLIAESKKERALLLLRKKRRLENISNSAEKQLDQLERLAHDIEFAQIQNQVVDGLKVGNSALKQLQDILNVEDIELLMDETKEAIDKQNEINELINHSSAVFGANLSDDLSDDMLEEELKELIQDQLPNVPQHDIPVATETVNEVVSKKKEKEPVLMIAE